MRLNKFSLTLMVCGIIYFLLDRAGLIKKTKKGKSVKNTNQGDNFRPGLLF